MKKRIQTVLTISYIATVITVVLIATMFICFATILFGLPWHWINEGDFIQATKELRKNLEDVLDRMLNIFDSE